MSSVSLQSTGLSKVTKSALKSHTQGISVTYTTEARAKPQRFVLRHGIDARRLQCGSALGIGIDLEEVGWCLWPT